MSRLLKWLFFRKQFFKRESIDEINRRLDKKIMKVLKRDKWSN